MKNRRDLDSSFEQYRRDRQFRRLQSAAPARPMGKNAAVLRELEEAEENEVRSERLTREVHDFFADATRQAAGIVNRISEAQEVASEHKIGDEMGEFLKEVIAHAEAFMMVLSPRAAAGGKEDLEANMHNILGAQLDEFRSRGTAQLQDKHIGQDPFKTPVPEEGSPLDAATAASSPAQMAPDGPSEHPMPGEQPGQPARPQRQQAHPQMDVPQPVTASPSPVIEPEPVFERPAVPPPPFEHPAPPPPIEPAPVFEQPAPPPIEPAPVFEQPAPPPIEPAPVFEQPHPAPAANPAGALPILTALAKDPARMRQALEVLVSTGVLQREEAQEMCRALLNK